MSTLLATGIAGCGDPAITICSSGKTFWVCTYEAQVSTCDCLQEVSEWHCSTDPESANDLIEPLIQEMPDIESYRLISCIDQGFSSTAGIWDAKEPPRRHETAKAP
ncbi:hypothetical protein [Sorangium sp. So ce362]|uniref:hypothetical protein n=1 Tax=Sorangium sp. So ce362 TaxID=3133303 RepID=UPI003F5E83CC